MDRNTTIFIIIIAAVLFVLVLFIINNLDRKQFIKPDDGFDAVNEEIRKQHQKRERI